MFNSTRKPPNRQRLMELEPPTKKLHSDGDAFIKKLAQKQTCTKTNLKEQLAIQTRFQTGPDHIPLPNQAKGTNSLEKFNSLCRHTRDLEFLKSAGLSRDEIDIFLDLQLGYDYLKYKHRNINEQVLQQLVEKLTQQVNDYEHLKAAETSHSNEQRLHGEMISALKPQSVETKLLKFATESRVTDKTIPNPMDEVKCIEQAMTDLDEMVSVKKIRKKARNLANKVIVAATLPFELGAVNRAQKLGVGTKWDKKEMPETRSREKPRDKDKVIGCDRPNYYTVRNGEIVRVDPTRVTEFKRYTVEEITALPRFAHYEPGDPSTTLYLKNLANGVTESVLRDVIDQCGKGVEVTIKVMDRRMRGQAFIDCPDVETSTHLLEKLNGVLLMDKPIIVHFGVRKIPETSLGGPELGE